MRASPRSRPGPRFVGAGAVVTGASRGIGEAIARALAHEGLPVLLVGRDATRLSSVAAEITHAGGTAFPLVQDLNAPDAADHVLRAAVDRLEAPYLLVNNAGIATAQRFDRRPREEWERELMTDLISPLRLTSAFLPTLLERRAGHVIFLGSASADEPIPRLAVYSGAKAALRGFGRALDLEVARRGVRVSVVEPVYVRTELGRRPTDAEAPLERRAREHPRSTLEPDVVARAVVRVLYRPRPLHRVPWAWAIGHGVIGTLAPLTESRRRLPPPAGDRPA
ncbi:MAG TPA: SDR family NAD(P)-dependent oxidoreductase [Thermoplasmata archaeon]|nr:SDR family NAD(P)-dependent oxidoreductase [Thermoplasmata archaeon]